MEKLESGRRSSNSDVNSPAARRRSTRNAPSPRESTQTPPPPLQTTSSSSALPTQTNPDAAKTSIDHRNIEIEELKAKINQISNKITELDTEKETYIYQISELKKRYQRDMEILELELASTNESCQNMEEKLSGVEKIESAIIQLYVEMKDRTIEVVRENDDDERYGEERLEIDNLKKENPLVILDRLKANLRTLLSFQEDFHEELKRQIDTRKIDIEERVEEMQTKISSLEMEQEQLKENEIRAIQIRNESVNSKKVIINESNKRIGEMKAENLRLVAEIKELERSIDELHDKLDDRDEKLRDRAIEMTKIDKLDDRIQKDRNKHQFDKNRLKSDHFKVREVYDKELTYYNKIKTDKIKMEAELERIQKQIEEFKQYADRSKVRDMEKRDQELQKEFQALSAELKEVNSKLHSNKTKVVNLRKENIRVKKKYQNLFLSSMNDEKKRQGDVERIIRHFKENTDVTPQATYYKEMFMKKDRESADLSRRVKRMILIERQESKYQKNFEVERNLLFEQLSKLKKEAMDTLPEDMWKTEEDLRKHNLALERKLRDYENMKSLAKSQQHAFERLADNNNPALFGIDFDNRSLSSTRLSFSRSSFSEKLTARRPSSAPRIPHTGSMYNLRSNKRRRPSSASVSRKPNGKIGSARSTIELQSLVRDL